MKRVMVLAGSVIFGLMGAACSEDAPPDGMAAISLPSLPGLEARVPAGTAVSKNAVGIGVMLKGPGISMTIGPEIEVDAKSLKDAKHNAQSYSPTNLAEQTLPDGYILTYENQGSTGTNYWLVGRREFGVDAYTCGVSSPKQAHQQSAIAICKSLAKKK